MRPSLAPRFGLALTIAFTAVVFSGLMMLADGQPAPTSQQLDAMARRFAPIDIGADISALPANERKALARLVDASHLMDAIFLRQAWAGNDALLMRLHADASPLGRSRLEYFLLNKGPWSRIDLNRPFIPGV